MIVSNLTFADLSIFCGVSNAHLLTVHKNKGFGTSALWLLRIANRLLSYDLGRPLISPPIRASGETQRFSFRALWKTYIQACLGRIEPCLPLNSKIKIPKKWEPVILDLYGESNQQLCEDYGLPLSQYGYPVKPEQRR